MGAEVTGAATGDLHHRRRLVLRHPPGVGGPGDGPVAAEERLPGGEQRPVPATGTGGIDGTPLAGSATQVLVSMADGRVLGSSPDD